MWLIELIIAAIFWSTLWGTLYRILIAAERTVVLLESMQRPQVFPATLVQSPEVINAKPPPLVERGPAKTSHGSSGVFSSLLDDAKPVHGTASAPTNGPRSHETALSDADAVALLQEAVRLESIDNTLEARALLKRILSDARPGPVCDSAREGLLRLYRR